MRICTWMFAETPDDESHYPQVSGRTSSRTFQEVYWRCVIVFFATSIRVIPDAQRTLYTNAGPRGTIGKLEIDRWLADHGVNVVELPFSFRPPPDYYPAWRNQFFVFDIIRHLSSSLDPDEAAVVLDSDCMWTAAPANMESAIRQFGALTYVFPRPADEIANGLTRYDLGALFTELGVPRTAPDYCGGEFIAATGSAMASLNEVLSAVFPAMLERRRDGQLAFNTESQTLSFAYAKLGYPMGTGNPFVRRIWTGLPLRYTTAQRDDVALPIWHVPAEKRRGLRRIYNDVISTDSPFWSLPIGSDWRHYLASMVGIPRGTLRKNILDIVEVLTRARL